MFHKTHLIELICCTSPSYIDPKKFRVIKEALSENLWEDQGYTDMHE
jgi:hypothetical protein